jgi:hypothetical protein
MRHILFTPNYNKIISALQGVGGFQTLPIHADEEREWFKRNMRDWEGDGPGQEPFSDQE